MAAVRAGVTTIEHGSFADREAMDLIKKKDVVYVATRTITELLVSSGGEGLAPQIWEKAKLVAKANREAYALAISMGLKVALGTDMSPGFNAAKELEYAVEAGMSNLEAIKAATANGPLTVGLKAPKTGQLKVGYEADIIGLLANPVEDVKVLQEIYNVQWVWKGGKAFKGPGVGPWGE
jgi:imidazolonepropionase-like amidohydrolase